MKGIRFVLLLLLALCFSGLAFAQDEPKYDTDNPEFVNELLESIESSRKDKEDRFPERFSQYVASIIKSRSFTAYCGICKCYGQSRELVYLVSVV